jgi:hypothetical protein
LLEKLGRRSLPDRNKFINEIVVKLQKHQLDIPVLEEEQLARVLRV